MKFGDDLLNELGVVLQSLKAGTPGAEEEEEEDKNDDQPFAGLSAKKSAAEKATGYQRKRLMSITDDPTDEGQIEKLYQRITYFDNKAGEEVQRQHPYSSPTRTRAMSYVTEEDMGEDEIKENWEKLVDQYQLNGLNDSRENDFD